MATRVKRTIKRESVVTHRGRPLVLMVPPTCDVLQLREKGRRTLYEIDILSVFSMAARKAAEQNVAERAVRRRMPKRHGFL